MSLKPSPIEPVPEGTARVAQAAFRKGNALLKLLDGQGFVGIYNLSEQDGWLVRCDLPPDHPQHDVFRRAYRPRRGRRDLQLSLH